MEKIDRAKLTPYLLNELELFEKAGVEHTRLRLQSNNIIGPPYDLALIWIAQKDAEAAALLERRRVAREAELAAGRAADREAEEIRRAAETAHREERERAESAYRAAEATKSSNMSRLMVQTLAVAIATLVAGLLAWLLPRH